MKSRHSDGRRREQRNGRDEITCVWLVFVVEASFGWTLSGAAHLCGSGTFWTRRGASDRLRWRWMACARCLPESPTVALLIPPNKKRVRQMENKLAAILCWMELFQMVPSGMFAKSQFSVCWERRRFSLMGPLQGLIYPAAWTMEIWRQEPKVHERQLQLRVLESKQWSL